MTPATFALLQTAAVSECPTCRALAAALGPRPKGRKPFGDRPGETVTATFIANRRQLGDSWSAIAAALNACGTPTRDGKKWHHGTVKRIATRGGKR